jgi:exodeoxyribonuclease VII small subunit
VTTNPQPQPEPDIGALSYEQARDELVSIVARLESGQVPLEESMALWHRGEALAGHCTRYLDGAQAELAQADEAAASAPIESPPAGA